MKTFTLIAFTLFLTLLISITLTLQSKESIVIETTSPVQFVGKVKISDNDSMRVRLLILKHCKERMADGDANLAIEAVDLAAARGLDIKEIGNHYVNRNGPWRTYTLVKLDQLKDFISEQMKVDAEPGDTLVVFTIGHGMQSGDLQFMGQRREVMEAIADAAEENAQETLWWQLSCYATASLPKISSLNPTQQDLFSIVASSDANHTSAAYVQGKHMEKVFLAMAKKDKQIDPNEDNIITAQELSDFLSRTIGNNGRLVFAKSSDEPIFGLLGGLANSIPILNHEGPNQFPRQYIPFPSR